MAIILAERFGEEILRRYEENPVYIVCVVSQRIHSCMELYSQAVSQPARLIPICMHGYAAAVAACSKGRNLIRRPPLKAGFSVII